jgi:hypothetical protein
MFVGHWGQVVQLTTKSLSLFPASFERMIQTIR